MERFYTVACYRLYYKAAVLMFLFVFTVLQTTTMVETGAVVSGVDQITYMNATSSGSSYQQHQHCKGTCRLPSSCV